MLLNLPCHIVILRLCHFLSYVNTPDDSNSLMHFDVEVEQAKKKKDWMKAEGKEKVDVEGTFSEKLSKTDKNKVHNDSAEFKHLKQMNMNDLTARVCVVARKPAA